LENYFNYFTEIEECFQRARGSPTLLSTLDWALIESWKEAGIPLEAVITGIERTFEKYHRRPRRFQKVNSLAYCSQEVLRAAQQAAEGEAGSARRTKPDESLEKDDFAVYLKRNVDALRAASRSQEAGGQSVLAQDLSEVAESLAAIAAEEKDWSADPEELERRLTALEDKLTASLTRAASVELLAEFRSEIDRAMAPYRRNLATTEIESLERQFIKKGLFEHFNIPRLSLFYMWPSG
jgi:hypothetical protein